MSLFFKPKRYFTILPYRQMARTEYLIQPVFDLYARRFRKMSLDQKLIEKQPLILPAKRLRSPEDTLLRMRKNHESAGAILARDEFPHVDIVLDQKQGITLRHIPFMNQQIYEIRIPETGEIIKVSINNIEFRDREGWIPWMHFNRFVVGRPNLVYIPIKARKGFTNPTLNRGGTLQQNVDGVYAYVYNDDYPQCFEVDAYNVSTIRGYRIGDLMNLFPDGMVIHPKHEKELTRNIFVVKANTYGKLINQLKFDSNVKEEQKTVESLEELWMVKQDDNDEGEKKHAEGEREEGEEEITSKGSKSAFDKIVDKRTTIKAKDITAVEAAEETKTYREEKREEALQKKAEARKKMGLKTPFSNVKKGILEAYSLKENFKDKKESKDKKGGGSGDKGGAAAPPPSK